jgi:Tn3 transposase DDE domain
MATHFGMALANLVGFDLAPRLAGMNKRKLYLPRGLDVPAQPAANCERDRLNRCHHSGMGPASADWGIYQEWLVFGELRSGPLWQRRAGR